MRQLLRAKLEARKLRAEKKQALRDQNDAPGVSADHRRFLGNR
jgi:hypothetical protein